MILITETLIVALVAYRIWRLAGQDRISDGVRGRLPARVAHILECGWCAGSWTALAVAFGAAELGWVDDSRPLVVGLAAAVAVGWLSEVLV